jgi:hypothetical protein
MSPRDLYGPDGNPYWQQPGYQESEKHKAAIVTGVVMALIVVVVVGALVILFGVLDISASCFDQAYNECMNTCGPSGCSSQECEREANAECIR